MDVSVTQASAKVSGNRMIEERGEGVRNRAFPIPRTEQGEDRALPQGMSPIEELDFDMLRIFNRYHQRWIPDCGVNVGEESIPFDSRVLSKLSCFLAGVVGAAKNSGTERPTVAMSDISPDALRLLAEFLSGEKDLPNLLNEKEFALFTELVSFACRWRCTSLLTYLDKHAVRCLNQDRGITGSALSGAVSLFKALANASKIKNIVPSALRRFITENPELVTANNLKLAYWTKNYPKNLSELLKKLPEFQQTVCADVTNVTAALFDREITIVPESPSLWPIVNKEHALPDELAFAGGGFWGAEQQKQHVSEYLKCVESWQRSGTISLDMEERKEPFLIGLLLHVVGYSAINQDFAPFSCDLLCYLRDRFIAGQLSKESARLMLKLAEQNPTYLSLLREKKLPLHAQEMQFVDLLTYIESVALPEQQGLWSEQLLNTRIRVAQNWTSEEWKRVALPNLWQLFHAMLNQDEVSYNAISNCYRCLKELCAEEAQQGEVAQWVMEANTLLNCIQGELQWLGENKRLHRQIEVVTEASLVDVSLFHLTLNSEYISSLHWNATLLEEGSQPNCINWQSRNIAQIDVLQHVLECGELPDTVPLSEVDWDSLIHDLNFLGCYEPAEKLESALCKKVTFINVVDYWLFARQFKLEGLKQLCIKTINASGVVSLTPGPDESYELKELTTFDKLSIGQKEVVMQLLSEHYSTIKIKTWRGGPKLSKASQVKSLLQPNLVKAVSTVASISFPLIGAYIGWQSRVDWQSRLYDTGLLDAVYQSFSTFTGPLMDGLEILGLNVNVVGGTLPGFLGDTAWTGGCIMGGAIAGRIAYYQLRKVGPRVTRLFRRALPLARLAQPLRIRGPEIEQLPPVAAPADAQQLAHVLDENVQKLDLSHCSSQLTAGDIKWIAQRCPQLTELLLGVTKGLFGSDWLPLSKLNGLRKIAIVLEGNSQTDLSSINSFDLREFVPSWPSLEEVHVTVKKGIPAGKLQFFENCPSRFPLTVSCGSKSLYALIDKLPVSLRVLEGSLTTGGLFGELSDLSAARLARCCPNLSELRCIALTRETLETLAVGCDLERLVNCHIERLTNEQVQRLVHFRGQKLKEFTCLGSSDLTAVGLNAFAACKNLERLVVVSAMVENDEAIRPLLDAQIPFLSFPMVTGISQDTRWQLANRWMENLETMGVEELRSLLSSSEPNVEKPYLTSLDNFGLLALLGSKGVRSLVIALARKSLTWQSLETRLGFRWPDDELTSSQVPASALLLGLGFLQSRSFLLLDLTQKVAINEALRFLHATGFDPVVGLKYVLSFLSSSVKARSSAKYQEYLRLLSVEDYGISESHITQLLQRWKKTLENENNHYAELIREELGRVLFANQQQLMIGVQQIAMGPEQTQQLLAQLFPMTWRYFKNVSRKFWQEVHLGTNTDSRKINQRIQKLKETQAAAERDLTERQAAIEQSRTRREVRLADPLYRDEYGELLPQHAKGRDEAQRAEEAILDGLNRKIAQCISQIEELEPMVEQPSEKVIKALLTGAFLHPEGIVSLLRDTLLEFTDPARAPR